MLKNIHKNQKGAIAIMMTILILTSILSITIVANSIIVNNLRMNVVQVGATKAFFAGEAGIERMLWEVRKNAFDFTGCTNGDIINFDSSRCSTAGDTLTLGNSASTTLSYSFSDPVTTITAFGIYGDTGRNTEIRY